MTDWQEYLKQHQQRFIRDLTEFLQIPSVSSLPEHANDVSMAGEWVADRLRKIGVDHVEVLATGGHPVVYGDWLHAGEQPTVMIYGHFDVQPADPLELWHKPPFEPTIREERIYARGASDDKGNMLIPILAVEAMLMSTGRLPVNLKFFFEGQEEIGSPQLPVFIQKHRRLLGCDMVISADGGQWSIDQPAVVTGRRGICALQIDVQGADHDLHSGTFGGAVLNPIQALSHLLATMHSAEGKVAVAGFYDAVRLLTAQERKDIAAVPFDEEAYRSDINIKALFGEPGYTTYERTWARPTLELNGIWGGFQGEGIKTVLPSRAHAKISCRLVPDQVPDQIAGLVEAHVHRHANQAVKVTVQHLPGNAEPCLTPLDHPGNRAAFRVLQKVYGKKPHVIRMGGTIPVTGLFFKHLGAHMIGFAFGLKDENVHAPNEFFRLDSFARGQTAYGLLLEELSN